MTKTEEYLINHHILFEDAYPHSKENAKAWGISFAISGFCYYDLTQNNELKKITEYEGFKIHYYNGDFLIQTRIFKCFRIKKIKKHAT